VDQASPFQSTLGYKTLDQLLNDHSSLQMADTPFENEKSLIPDENTLAPLEQTKPENGISILPVPYLNYSDVYGMIYGAALALFEPSTQTRLTSTVFTNFNGYLRFRSFFQWRRPNEWIFNASGSIGNDTQTYFGEGDQTPSTFHSFQSNMNQVSTSFQLNLDDHLYLGPSIQYIDRTWSNQALSANPVIFQNENEAKVGIQSTWDSRDSVVEPRQGQFALVGVYALPSNGNVGVSADVFQFEGDFRTYVDLGGATLALRAKTGWSTGTPSYSFEYTLGGMNELRGFHSNQFRGSDFYEGQAELRVPLFNLLEVSTGVDGGDITDTTFNSPMFSYQVGVRTSALSSFGLTVRADLGFGYDGNEFALATSEPF
jgi:hypothetical protein